MSEKNNWRKQLNSIFRHCCLVIKPLAISAFTTALWYFFKGYFFCFDKCDEAVIVGAAVSTLGVAYGVLAAVIFGSVWSRFRKIAILTLKDDREGFLLIRDERVPLIVHIFLVSLSIAIVSIMMLVDYRNVESGAVTISILTFTLALCWFMLAELEEPAKSPWFEDRIPEEWMTADVDKEFGIMPTKKVKQTSKGPAVAPANVPAPAN